MEDGPVHSLGAIKECPRNPTAWDIQADDPQFRNFVLAKMKEEFDRTLKPVGGDDLEAIIKEEEGMPLDFFLQEIEFPIKSFRKAGAP